MRKLVAVILAAALVGCNEILDPGPPVQPTDHAVPAPVVLQGIVAQLYEEGFVIFPSDAPGFVRLQGNEDQLTQLVGVESQVRGYMLTDDVMHVISCQCASSADP